MGKLQPREQNKSGDGMGSGVAVRLGGILTVAQVGRGLDGARMPVEPAESGRL